MIFIDPNGESITPVLEKQERVGGKIIYNYKFDAKITIYTTSKGANATAVKDKVLSMLTSSFEGKFDTKYSSYNFRAGDIEITVASSMDEVDDDAHLVTIVDNVTGKNAKGGEAGGIAKLFGKIAYVEKGSIDGMAEGAVHELGHNFGLEHTWEDEFEGNDDNPENHMSYSSGATEFSGEQLHRIITNQHRLNEGANKEEYNDSDYDYTSRTTQGKPYRNVSKGDIIPKRLGEY